METEDEDITKLRENILETLQDLSHVGLVIERKAQKLETQINNGSLEETGIKLVKLLKNLKANSLTYLNILQQSLTSINSKKSNNEMLFSNMQTEILNCRSGSVVENNGEYSFVQLIDKETITETNIPLNTDVESLSQEVESVSSGVSSTSSKCEESLSTFNYLSLKRQNTTDTQTEDESWKDTLQRVPVKPKLEELTTETSEYVKNCDESNSERLTEKSKIDKNKEKSIFSSSDPDSDLEIEHTDRILSPKSKKISEESLKSSKENETSGLDDNTEIKLTNKTGIFDELTQKFTSDSNSNNQNSDSEQTQKLDVISDSESDSEKSKLENKTKSKLINSEELTQKLHENSENDSLKITNKDAIDNEEDEYENPFSVSTEKCFSDDDIEDNDTGFDKTVNLYDEHSYSASATSKESSVTNEDSKRKKSIDQDSLILISDSDSDTDSKSELKEVKHLQKKVIIEESDSYNIEDSDWDQNSTTNVQNDNVVEDNKDSDCEENSVKHGEKDNKNKDSNIANETKEIEDSDSDGTENMEKDNKDIEDSECEENSTKKVEMDSNPAKDVEDSDSEEHSTKNLENENKKKDSDIVNPVKGIEDFDCEENSTKNVEKENENGDSDKDDGDKKQKCIDKFPSTDLHNVGEVEDSDKEDDMGQNRKIGILESSNTETTLDYEYTSQSDGTIDLHKSDSNELRNLEDKSSSDETNVDELSDASKKTDCEKKWKENNKNLTYIHNEHDYSSSNSPTVASTNDVDSDETDIDREIDASQIVQLNKLDNFILENSKLSQTDSVRSFEFDISDYESIVNKTNDNNATIENDEVKRTFTPQPTNAIGNNKLIEDEINKNDIPDLISTPEPTNSNDDELKLFEDEIHENDILHRTSTPEPTKDDENEQISNSKTKDASNAEEFAQDLENLLNESLGGEMVESRNSNDNITENELLDCTLEEFLPKGEDGYTSSQNTIIYDVKPNIKIENESWHIKSEPNDNDSKLDNEVEKDKDDILELLKEVSISPSGDRSEQLFHLEDDSDASLKVDEILQALKEDQSEISSSDEFDSDIDLNDSLSSCGGENNDGNSSGDETKRKLKEYNMKECRIILEQMKLSEKDINKFSKVLNDDIDWLCDLNNLNFKRKKTSDKRFKKKGKKGASSIASASSTSYSSSSDSDCDNELGSDTQNLDGKLERRLDEILANAICNELKSDSSKNSDSDSDSESDSLTKKKKKKDNCGKSEKPELSKEEMEKKAWRKDSLLTDKLSDSDNNNPKAKKLKTYDYDSEFNLDSEHFDSGSDTDLEDIKKKVKLKLDENKISPVKRNLPDSDSDSSASNCDSDDSDVQFISPQKSSQNSEQTDNSSPSQKGRRKIRSILSDGDLAKETLNAKKDEMDRIKRLTDRHKIIETLSQSFSSQQTEQEEIPPLILDMDEDTGESLIQVNDIINKKLKPHQREGIKFMWESCYETLKRLKSHPGSGCILAHCMGLGKTFQVLALCQTLFSSDKIANTHVLIVCPLSTVNNWKKEIEFAFKGLQKNEQFSFFTIGAGKSKSDFNEKYRTVRSWNLRKNSMLILGYDCFEILTNHSKLDKVSSEVKNKILECLVDPGPDLVVCDEGHLIKNNKTLKAMALNKIKTSRRIVLTGTPLQNNLLEYYHMVNFVKPNLLGTVQEFKTNFVNPITNGQFEDSNEADINLMMLRTHVLHKILGKTVQRFEDTELEIYLPPMHDHAVFIQMNQHQVELYNHFSERARMNFDTGDKKQKRKFLSDFFLFQLICTHPHLLVLMERDRQKNKMIKEKDVITPEEYQPIIGLDTQWRDKIPEDSSTNIDYGNKLVVLKAIIDECEAVGDKLLVFSQCLNELDLIEHFLQTIGTAKCSSWRKKVDYSRMDGTVLPNERSNICDIFNDENNDKMRVLLMSTKVGGLGLNLTAANRVVIMTVNWNPSYDTQSVFRVYRFGQKKRVFVYRLVALDTMESKVYQRQVTKLAIAHRVVDKQNITRHYKSVDLQEMYSCKPNADNERPTPNVPDDEMLAKLILKLPCIFKYHEHKSLLADRPEDKLSEKELATAWEDFKNNKDTFKTAPPEQQYGAQQNATNGLTFETAYNFMRGNYNGYSDLNKNYYMPPPTNTANNYRPLPNNSQSNRNSNDVIFVPSTNPQSRIGTSSSFTTNFNSQTQNDSNLNLVGANRLPIRSLFNKNQNQVPASNLNPAGSSRQFDIQPNKNPNLESMLSAVRNKPSTNTLKKLPHPDFRDRIVKNPLAVSVATGPLKSPNYQIVSKKQNYLPINVTENALIRVKKPEYVSPQPAVNANTIPKANNLFKNPAVARKNYIKVKMPQKSSVNNAQTTSVIRQIPTVSGITPLKGTTKENSLIRPSTTAKRKFSIDTANGDKIQPNILKRMKHNFNKAFEMNRTNENDVVVVDRNGNPDDDVIQVS